ncbi:hypothetical protein TWF730_005359 [Orbilia blumenaviensis]|uniref:Uncharacterized protein n=1 Tax=Orbilia blumenaviensis TaxID=1796055 RepID=A0AAV9VKE8_9PEZI
MLNFVFIEVEPWPTYLRTAADAAGTKTRGFNDLLRARINGIDLPSRELQVGSAVLLAAALAWQKSALKRGGRVADRTQLSIVGGGGFTTTTTKAGTAGAKVPE